MTVSKRVGRSFLMVLAASALAVGPLQAQVDPDVPFLQIMVQRFDSLRQDSVVQRRTGAADALQLIGAIAPDALGRIDDASLDAFAELLARSLAVATIETCASVHRQGLDAAFGALATEMDSTLATEWVDSFEDMLWATVREQPIGTRAPAAEVRAAFLSAIQSLNAFDQGRFRRGYDKSGSDEDICYYTRLAYGELLKLPHERRGAVLRSAMFGPP